MAHRESAKQHARAHDLLLLNDNKALAQEKRQRDETRLGRQLPRANAAPHLLVQVCGNTLARQRWRGEEKFNMTRVIERSESGERTVHLREPDMQPGELVFPARQIGRPGCSCAQLRGVVMRRAQHVHGVGEQCRQRWQIASFADAQRDAPLRRRGGRATGVRRRHAGGVLAHRIRPPCRPGTPS